MVNQKVSVNEQEVVEAYSTKKSMRDIQKKFGISSSRIYRILAKHNISLDREFKNEWVGKTHTDETKAKMSNTRKEIWKEWQVKNYTAEEQKTVVERYVAGQSIHKITEDLGMFSEKIKNILEMNNIPLRLKK